MNARGSDSLINSEKEPLCFSIFNFVPVGKCTVNYSHPYAVPAFQDLQIISLFLLW